MKRFHLLLLVLIIFSVGACAPEQEQSEPPAKVRVAIGSRISTPLVTDDTVYFGTVDGILYAMDKQTARELWRFETGGAVWHPPAVDEGVVVFGSHDGKLRAVDAQGGELLWEFQAGQVDWEVRDIFINGTPNIVDGVVYFSSEDFNVYAVDLASGREVWRHRLEEEPQALEIPIVDGVAYIGAWDGNLHAIDIETGEERWRSQTEFRDQMSNQVTFVTVVPLVTEEGVYFTDWAGNLIAVELETGRQIWRFSPPTADLRHVGSRSHLAMHDDVVYYATLEDRHLYGVDRRTGEKVWEFEGEGYLYGPRSAGEGIALYIEYIPITEERPEAYLLRALDLETKQILWTADNISAPPSVHEAVVYHGATDGTVHGRDLRSGNVVWRLGAAPDDRAEE